MASQESAKAQVLAQVKDVTPRSIQVAVESAKAEVPPEVKNVTPTSIQVSVSVKNQQQATQQPKKTAAKGRRCKLCGTGEMSEHVYQQHVLGAKHRKNVKSNQQNEPRKRKKQGGKQGKHKATSVTAKQQTTNLPEVKNANPTTLHVSVSVKNRQQSQDRQTGTRRCPLCETGEMSEHDYQQHVLGSKHKKKTQAKAQAKTRAKTHTKKSRSTRGEGEE
jgi:hypothetical protein